MFQFIRRHPLLIVFLAAALGLSWAVWSRVQDNASTAGGPPGMGGPSGRGAGPVPVSVAVVENRMIADRVESVGTAVANESVDVTPKVTDTISRIHFQDGDFVEAGDVLVELTNTAESARLAEAQSNADDARRRYDRLQSLIGESFISENELDQAQTRLEAARAQLDGILANLEDRLVRAPFAGVLGFRNVSQGSLVSPSTVITTLDEIDTIKLDFDVPEMYLAQLESGLGVEAGSIVYRGRDFSGEVRSIGSRIDPVSRSVRVRAHIDNADRALRPGMLLTTTVALSPREVLVVPEQAIVPSQGSQYVFMPDGENVARRVEVELGRRRPGIVEIVSGVDVGDHVITDGIGQVRAGQPVRILNPPDSPLLLDGDGGRAAVERPEESNNS
ncbi:MAG: efflux RND transporter periplasmic adaptor subunit [Pseudomonadota bacterium]